MLNLNPEVQGLFVRVWGQTSLGYIMQWQCAVCHGRAVLGPRYGMISCANSPDKCSQGRKVYAQPVIVLEPYDPERHG